MRLHAEKLVSTMQNAIRVELMKIPKKVRSAHEPAARPVCRAADPRSPGLSRLCGRRRTLLLRNMPYEQFCTEFGRYAPPARGASRAPALHHPTSVDGTRESRLSLHD